MESLTWKDQLILHLPLVGRYYARYLTKGTFREHDASVSHLKHEEERIQMEADGREAFHQALEVPLDDNVEGR